MKEGYSMPREAQILPYDFEVNMDIQAISSGSNAVVSPDITHKIVSQLNTTTISDQIDAAIAAEMQNEMKGVLSNYRVSIEIFFNEGSIIAIGTILITILSPLAVELGKTILEEGVKALVSELTPVIRVAIQRALRRILPPWLQNHEISRIEVAVSPGSSARVEDKQSLKPAEIKTDLVPTSETRTDPTSKDVERTKPMEANTGSLGNKQVLPQYFILLPVVNTILLIVLIILLSILIIRFP
jgi:hypothetical protein